MPTLVCRQSRTVSAFGYCAPVATVPLKVRIRAKEEEGGVEILALLFQRSEVVNVSGLVDLVPRS